MFNRLAPVTVINKKIKASLLSLVLLLTTPAFSLPILANKASLPPSLPPNTPTSSVPVESDYTLGAGDRLRVTIYQVADLSGEFLVLVDGTVGFPLVGNLKVQDLTLPQLQTILIKQYTRYLKRPVVTVGLITPRPLKIAIAGEVNSPGAYTHTFTGVESQKFPSVTDLIQQAAGITAAANVRQVQIQRVVQGKKQVITVDLWALLQKGDQTQNITLRDGDSIFIPTVETTNAAEVRQLADANFGLRADQELNVAVVGEVNRPGTYKISTPPTNPTATTSSTITTGGTQKKLPRLSFAIQTAGGIKPLADIRDVQVRRFTRNGQQQEIKVDLWNLLQTGDISEDILLQDGDTIVIPTAKNINAQEAEPLASASFSPNTIRVNVVGEVAKPGSVEIPPNTPLNQALLAAGGFDNRRAEKSSIELIRLNPNGTVSKRNINVNFSGGITEETNPTLRNNDVIVVNRNGITETTDTINTILSPLAVPLGFLGVFNIFK